MFVALLAEVGIMGPVMEVSIVGPGAVGTLLGGLLAARKHQVVLVGKKPPSERAPSGDERRGRTRAGPRSVPGGEGAVRVVLPDRWVLSEVRRAGPADAPASPDAVLVTLGRHHLHVLRRPDFSRLTGGGESPVALFNCDPGELERLAVAPDRLRLCLSLLTAVQLQDSDVELVTEKPVILYESSKSLDRLFRELSGFGFQCTAVADARPHLNSLLVWQLLFLPLAMCNTTLDVFLSFPEGRELAAGLISEGCEAMEKAGMSMAALPAMDPRELLGRLQKKPDSFTPLPERPDRSFNSLLQGLLAGKPTEAPQLNRRIVEIASSAGLHLTWNWRILQKLSRVSGIGFYRTPGDLMRSLA
jgi:ketopantoate reductase